MSVGSGEAREGVAVWAGVAVLGAFDGLDWRAREERVGRWTGFISDMGGNGDPLEVMETFPFGFLEFLVSGVSENRLWNRPLKLERTPLDKED